MFHKSGAQNMKSLRVCACGAALKRVRSCLPAVETSFDVGIARPETIAVPDTRVMRIVLNCMLKDSFVWMFSELIEWYWLFIKK